ncbi:unnamed protein product [Brachionus calyciflorus]|uniref:DDE Tnp4 domain-containing protein n=1 Tax=Brachionus calyciflorus TaxID=104777 RepID=A0A814DW41_9BILA|nr:unnamed protein product [Brachionus calyciflorus]
MELEQVVKVKRANGQFQEAKVFRIDIDHVEVYWMENGTRFGKKIPLSDLIFPKRSSFEMIFSLLKRSLNPRILFYFGILVIIIEALINKMNNLELLKKQCSEKNGKDIKWFFKEEIVCDVNGSILNVINLVFKDFWLRSCANPLLTKLSSAQIIATKNSDTQFNENSQKAPNILSKIEISPTVFGATNTFVCENKENCQQITEYSIASNHTFDCTEKYIPINFNAQIGKKSVATFGFLSESGLIFEEQKYFESCKKIKRAKRTLLMSKKNSILTALSSHSKCFVCNRSAKLHQVKPETVVLAYSKFKIYIKHDSRCCHRHLDEYGILKEDCLKNLNVKKKYHSNSTVDLLNTLKFLKQRKKGGMFDAFDSLSTLDNNYCYQITGWSKKKFIKFSNYITSINESSGRSKNQLIALYRYWLRKGIDQFTLSKLFGETSNQTQISHYLDQIRRAINKDFVPFFLGSTKEREFYLNHNNTTVKNLHNLSIDTLAVVVDASYIRLEKSSNNHVQYMCWSEQKKDLLIKPFLVVCADGWIIDCYGPFAANLNDAAIFDYILEVDHNLRKILLPNKTIVFLDRGFRDIVKKLVENFKFDAQIPTCKQLQKNNLNEKKEIKQLTLEQTTQSRFVTKCRFIVEKQFGYLKNHKSLDNIRNTQAGHIQVDFRIACAMSNYSHKPCCPDGKNSNNISEAMKQKSNIKENSLEFFINKHLNTKDILNMSLSDIVDFPKLNLSVLSKEIFLGTYQLKECKSYLSDVIENGVCYIISDNLKKKYLEMYFTRDLDSKIIAFEILSRHKRSYICNCMSGRKVVGCCVHVASIIFFLSFAKYTEIKHPAEHLKKIFVNTNKKDLPNSPEIVRNKRKNVGLKNFEEEDSRNSQKSGDNLNNKNFIDLDKKELQDKKDSSKNSNEIIEQENCEKSNENIELENFERHIPKWGALINYQNQKINVDNTCPIDYHLLGLWHLSKLKPNHLIIENSNFYRNLNLIIDFIDDCNWNNAREIWINNVMNFSDIPVNKKISLFGSELRRFITFFGQYQRHQVIQKCSENCYFNLNLVINDDADNIFFIKEQKTVKLFSCFTEKCNNCQSKIETLIQFYNKPNFVYIQSAHNNINVTSLPKEITIENNQYRFLYSTIHKPGHFLGVFEINELLYLVDDLDQSCKLWYDESFLFKQAKTTISFYFLV